MRILLVEDDSRMRALLERGLAEEGHTVTAVKDGVEGVEVARAAAYDVIILDVMLPRMDGFQVAAQLRSAGNKTPILMLTARDAPQDIVRGLDSGADDYLAKPFSFEVLLARLRAVSRRGPVLRDAVLKAGGLEMDLARHEVRRGGGLIPLTRTEFALLELLMRRAGAVVTRERILEAVWGDGHVVEPNTLEAFVRKLRMKVEGGGRKLIQTVRGVGYSLREEDE